MKTPIKIWGLMALALLAPVLSPVLAHSVQLPPTPQVEKDLASRASNVTEITLGKNMLNFAAKFMNGKDQDEAATRHLIEGLDGIYVRSYEFDKEAQYSLDEIEQLRKYFETSEWSTIVREHERKTGETNDVMVKLVNGEPQGLFILSSEPKELTIVLIVGPVKVEDLAKLKGIAGLGSLGDVQKHIHSKEKEMKKDRKDDDQ